MTDILHVFFEERHVGCIKRTQGNWSFEYDDVWLNSADGFAVSISLPLRKEPFLDEAARSFFANLLPEAGIREQMARSIGVSLHNDFELLKAFGGECAGALSVIDSSVPERDRGEYTLIDEDALALKIRESGVHPLLLQDGVRLSLAGAQQKIPVFFDQGRFYLPKGAAATTHILKPSMAAFPKSVENEFFCMRLASAIGLPAADVSMIAIGGDPVLVCGRYDRFYQDGKLVRVHQEDFCQALGYSYDQKYESEGGPGIKECFDLLERYGSEPLVDKMNLLRWIIFNWKIGNADAHAKNISILYRDRGIRLAPFYDLMSTAEYPSLASRMAMKVGGENRPDWIKGRHWQRMAQEVGIKASLVEEEFLRIIQAIDDQSRVLADQFKIKIKMIED